MSATGRRSPEWIGVYLDVHRGCSAREASLRERGRSATRSCTPELAEISRSCQREGVLSRRPAVDDDRPLPRHRARRARRAAGRARLPGRRRQHARARSFGAGAQVASSGARTFSWSAPGATSAARFCARRSWHCASRQSTRTRMRSGSQEADFTKVIDFADVEAVLQGDRVHRISTAPDGQRRPRRADRRGGRRGTWAAGYRHANRAPDDAQDRAARAARRRRRAAAPLRRSTHALGAPPRDRRGRLPRGAQARERRRAARRLPHRLARRHRRAICTKRSLLHRAARRSSKSSSREPR